MFCTDQRGFNTWLKGEASTFLESNDSRLALNTAVTKVNYTDTGVVVETSDGKCFEAEYAIVTLPLGVLQSDTVKFSPAFPSWKKEAIATFRMGTYLKMFIQFNETFWNSTNENMLYASPTTRGYLAEWHNIGADNIHPGSNMLLVTAIGQIASRIERQTDEETRAEVIAVLQQMFPDIVVPEPIAFLYPRWGLQPYSFGTYSHWPAGASLEMHQNLRANVGRVFFAGEAQSTQYFSFLQGAWFEGRESGQRVAGLLGKNCSGSTTSCGNMLHYETLHATTQQDEFKTANGWYVDTF
jgi:polyamine oxidase